MTDKAMVTPVRERIERMIRDLNDGAILGYDGPQEYWSTRMGAEASAEIAGLLSAALAQAEQPVAVSERAALQKAAEALRPMADAVFNDNGDMTVNLFMPSGEECIQAYFAERLILSALAHPPAKREAGETAPPESHSRWTVPIHKDGNYVFIDGSGDVELDHGGKMREALEWYAEQARLARLIHSEGDKGRHALADDGGRIAREALDRQTTPPVSRERVSDTPSAALEAPLNSFEIEVLEMLAGKRDGQWGAWVGAVLGTLSGRGLCTRGPNYQITDTGRAALEASHE